MILKILWVCGLSVVTAASLAATPAPGELSATQIVERNVAARGGLAAWSGVSTLTMSGVLEAGGKKNAELPFVMKMKRGHKSRLEIRFQEQAALQVYDGAQGWKIRPFLNRNEVEPYTPAEAKSAASWEELDGPLINHQAKGTRVELAGTEAVDGNSAYKLHLTLKSGEQRDLWIDAKTFLERKIDGEPRKMDGRLRKVAIHYRDFKTDNGLTTPRLLETVVAGVKQTHKMSITKVVANEPMDEALFRKPSLAVASLQTR